MQSSRIFLALSILCMQCYLYEATAMSSSSSVGPLDTAERYKVIHYLNRRLEQDDPKVRDLNIRYLLMFNHIYFSYDLCNKRLSMVSQRDGSIDGVNLVMSLRSLPLMYAPPQIKNVLDFVLPCYKQYDSPHWHASVAILRASNSTLVNKRLIQSLAHTFQHEERASILFLWEDRAMGSLLRRQGFVRLVCGSDRSKCDWNKAGVPRAVADNICLYSLKSE